MLAPTPRDAQGSTALLAAQVYGAALVIALCGNPVLNGVMGLLGAWEQDELVTWPAWVFNVAVGVLPLFVLARWRRPGRHVNYLRVVGIVAFFSAGLATMYRSWWALPAGALTIALVLVRSWLDTREARRG